METITVDHPLVIGFFPDVESVMVDDPDALDTDLEHFELGLEATAVCLQTQDVPVTSLHADRVILVGRTYRTIIDVRWPPTTTTACGCVLAVPDREPIIVRATAGTSSLGHACRAAAARYFGARECCPEGQDCR